MTSTHSRQDWPDVARAVATMAVVCLHSAAPWIGKFKTSPFYQWQLANVIESPMRIAVPIFFMLSGYLLIGREDETPLTWAKRFARILVAWAVWTLVYWGYDLACGRSGANSFFSRSYYHLWFLPALAACYLFVPVLTWGFRENREMRERAVLLVWLVGMPFGMPSVFTHLGYLVLGSALGDFEGRAVPRIVWLGLFILGVAATVVGTTLATQKAGGFVIAFYEYSSWNVVVMAAAFFALVRASTFPPRFLEVCRKVCEKSFGIYLLHPLILDVSRSAVPRVFDRSPLGIPLTAVFVFVVSYAVVDAFRRLNQRLGTPFVRN